MKTYIGISLSLSIVLSIFFFSCGFTKVSIILDNTPLKQQYPLIPSLSNDVLLVNLERGGHIDFFPTAQYQKGIFRQKNNLIPNRDSSFMTIGIPGVEFGAIAKIIYANGRGIPSKLFDKANNRRFPMDVRSLSSGEYPSKVESNDNYKGTEIIKKNQGSLDVPFTKL